MSKAEAVSALGRAKTGTLEYYSVQPVLPTATKLRDMSALEAMYAYFGSDET